MSEYPNELIILVADKDMESMVRGLLKRPDSLGTRQILSVDIHVHPFRDSGCYKHSHEFLRPFLNQYGHALVIFDRDFDKKRDLSGPNLESEVKQSLEQNGWKDRCEVVVIDPELESWVWSGSPCVEEILKWPGASPDLKSWLIDQGKWDVDSKKPQDPKAAMEAAMRQRKVKKSSSLFRRIGERSKLDFCSDRAFLKFRQVFQNWFPQP
jgi:hypothetical protein